MNTNKKNTVQTVGVRFRPNGKIYNFSCGMFSLKTNEYVVAETDKGIELGRICRTQTELSSNKKLKKRFILRKANKKDLQQLEKNKKLEKQAFSYCANNIKRLGLKMNLFAVKSTFDTSRLTFFFTADGRVDFRQLVKTLVKKNRSRIEMRQVGVRNQARMCGGVGRCGQILCCASFLNKFEPISIKMAKRQGLSLNPTKISGQCGRLMCCLTFEDEVYKKTKTNTSINKTTIQKNSEQ